ncbi:MAG TPA: MoaD/ThiS family protein [Methanobacterium sp.]|nr:MoaD/ThiS family protein [Methanobacterium sp.]
MMVKVTDGMGNDEEVEIDAAKITGKELLKKLDITVFEAIIEKNNQIVSENEILTNADRVKVLNMIHGG